MADTKDWSCYVTIEVPVDMPRHEVVKQVSDGFAEMNKLGRAHVAIWDLEPIEEE